MTTTTKDRIVRNYNSDNGAEYRFKGIVTGPPIYGNSIAEIQNRVAVDPAIELLSIVDLQAIREFYGVDPLNAIVSAWHSDRQSAGATQWFDTVLKIDHPTRPIYFVAKSYANWIQRAELTIGDKTTVFGFESKRIKSLIARLSATIDNCLTIPI